MLNTHEPRLRRYTSADLDRAVRAERDKARGAGRSARDVVRLIDAVADRFEKRQAFGLSFAFGPSGSFTAPNNNDLRIGDGAANLVSWHRAEHGVTLDSAMFGTGSTLRTTTLSGDLSNAQPVYIDIETGGQVGAGLTIHAALDENGANRVLTSHAVNTAAVAIPGSGKTVTFATGVSYAADNIYQAAVQSWEPLHGTAGAAGHRLDNSTVTASPGCVYEAHGLNETRAAVKMAPGLLGNQGALGAIAAGSATPFHLFYVAEMVILPNTTAVHALFGWFSQTVANAHIIDWIVTGTTASPPNAWGVQRINSTPTTQRYDSDGTDGFPAVVPDNSPHIFEIEYNGTTMIARINGFEIATGTWSGTVTSNRFCLGGVKLGANAATAFASHRASDLAIYNTNLSAAVAASVRARLA